MRFAAILAAAIGAGVLVHSVPAQAHRLLLHVALEQGRIVGHVGFVGGGRARGAEVRFEDADGATLHHAITGPDGRFGWTPPAPQTIRVRVRAGHGHTASATIGADRFSAPLPPQRASGLGASGLEMSR